MCVWPGLAYIKKDDDSERSSLKYRNLNKCIANILFIIEMCKNAEDVHGLEYLIASAHYSFAFLTCLTIPQTN